MEHEDTTPRVISCARYGELDELKQCLANGEPLYCEDGNGNTALHMACGNGFADIVAYIIEESRNDPHQFRLLNARNKNGSSALQWAALNGHADVVELLVNARCDIHGENVQGKTAFYYAEQNRHEAVLNILLSAMEQQSLLRVAEDAESEDEEEVALQDSSDTRNEVSELNDSHDLDSPLH